MSSAWYQVVIPFFTNRKDHRERERMKTLEAKTLSEEHKGKEPWLFR